tara:strand:- start:272 stop:859 length:588 start_codon:yes stop_codon:yes gene_type:complete
MSDPQLPCEQLQCELAENFTNNVIDKIDKFVSIAYEKNNRTNAITEEKKNIQISINLITHNIKGIIEKKLYNENTSELLDYYNKLKELLKLRTTNNKNLYNIITDEMLKSESNDKDITDYLNFFISKSKTSNAENGGGKKSKKLPKKEILGKMRSIYKIPGDKKEYLKHKGKLITVKEYKELMKAKPKKVKKNQV